MDNDPALPQAQECGNTDSGPENSFSFTPIKTLQALPRLWDRKPSTPFRAGQTSRKLWKRFRSLTGMASAQHSTAADQGPPSNINAPGAPEHLRGVKRLCVDFSDAEVSTDSGLQQLGRSFLETKWESGASRKRRKMPDVYDETLQTGTSSQPGDSVDDVGGNKISNDLDVSNEMAISASPRPLHFLQEHSKTTIYNDGSDLENQEATGFGAKTPEDQESRPADNGQRVMIDAGKGEKGEMVPDTMQDLTQEQEGTLVRSALRSSLDGEDAELLNDFLSKAKAKRAAKAALVSTQDAQEVEKSSSPEESPESECATPRSRRALEDLDANSPSPVKVPVSPGKGGLAPVADAQEDVVSKDPQDDEPAPASPACRRSTRAKAPPSTNAAPGRNTISLRRAKGTEFVFLQRTEAQELALATKRNTRRNKGNSILPKFVLEILAQQSTEKDPSTDSSERADRSDRKGPGSRRPAGPRKTVSWNEARLVEYEDTRLNPEEEEEGDSCKSDVGGASRLRSSAKRSDKKTASSRRSQETRDADSGAGGLTAPAPTPPRSRRMRHLGDSGTMGSGTPVKTGRGTSKPPAASAPVAASGPSTPTKSRRKLVPKSPSSSLLPAPASKGDQPFVSSIPTRSTKSAGESSKRKSMLQVSAGSTPMPRRVRARS